MLNVENQSSRSATRHLFWLLFLLLVTLVLFVLFGNYLIDSRTKGNSATTERLPAKSVAKNVTVATQEERDYKSPIVGKTISLTLVNKEMRKLVAMGKSALAVGTILKSHKQFVPVKISSDGNNYEGYLRIKGDAVEHLRAKKWSFRVKLRGNNTLYGLKTFSLHSPEARSFMFEWLFHRIYRYEGGIAPRYEFVNLILNGKKLGVYALEEHFEKRLIEFHQRREGPIVKFSEDRMWEVFRSRNDKKHFHSAPVQVFQEEKTSANPILKANFRRAYKLMEGFRTGDLNAQSVFNVDLFAKYIALSDLFNTWHSLRWHNQRFYYDPVSDRLEPIAFDASFASGVHEIAFTKPREALYKKLFNDEYFVTAYMGALEKFSKPKYVDDFFATIAKSREHAEKILKQEYPKVHFHNDRFLKFNQQAIRRRFSIANSILAAVVEDNDREIEIKIANTYDLPIEPTGCQISGEEFSITPANSYITPMLPGKVPQFHFFQCETTKNVSAGESFRVNYKIAGTSLKGSSLVTAWDIDSSMSYFKESGISGSSDTYKEVTFIDVDEDEKTISIRKGEWEITKSIVIPSGYTFRIKPGTKLRLSNAASLVSYSPVHFIGSEEEPIYIVGSGYKGEGLLVLKTGEKESLLRHVNFLGLNRPKNRDWELTGAVTFYESAVRVSNSSFSDNSSEDALNIVRSEFSIEKSAFLNVHADAFDSDFSRGEISGSVFSTIGNDAIDVSGGNVSISRVSIEEAQDKAISAGEKCNLNISDVDIKGATVGIASKDSSYVLARRVSIDTVTIGAAAYQKKPEYGPAKIKLVSLELDSKTSLPFLIEDGSRIIRDDKIIAAKRKEKEKILIDKLIAGLPIQ